MAITFGCKQCGVRLWAYKFGQNVCCECLQAEIKRLRGALEEIANEGDRHNILWTRIIATDALETREALEEK